MNNLALKRRASENFVDDEMNESASRKNKVTTSANVRDIEIELSFLIGQSRV